MTGGGVLVKSGHDTYERTVIRDPGSLKVAQWGNPESWGPGVNMSLEHWNTRRTFERGVAYAKRWKAYEKGLAPKPKRETWRGCVCC